MSEDSNNVSIEEGGASFTGFTFKKTLMIALPTIMVLMLIFSWFLNSPAEKEIRDARVDVAPGVGLSDANISPTDVMDPEIEAEIARKHDAMVNATARQGVAIVAPVIGVTEDDAKATAQLQYDMAEAEAELMKAYEAVETPEPKSNNNSQGQQTRQDINPYVSKIQAAYSAWDVNRSGSDGVNLLVPQDLQEQAEGEVLEIASGTDIQNQEYIDELKSRGIDFLEIYPASLNLGYNSDVGDIMIIEVYHPKLKGVKFQASVTLGAYNERAAITLNKAVLDDGSVISVNGVVVDQNSRIPSVTGKVKRHLLHNTIFGLGVSLLDSFGAYKQMDSGLVQGISLFPSTQNDAPTLDTDGLLVANGASSLASSLRENGSFRPNTLTTKAFKTVGVVFLP